MMLDYPHAALCITRLFSLENIFIKCKTLSRNSLNLKFTVTSDVYEDRLEAVKLDLNNNLPFKNALSAQLEVEGFKIRTLETPE